MTTFLIALYFFIAGLTAEWVSSQLSISKAKASDRWCLSLFCGILWPLFLFVFLVNR